MIIFFQSSSSFLLLLFFFILLLLLLVSLLTRFYGRRIPFEMTKNKRTVDTSSIRRATHAIPPNFHVPLPSRPSFPHLPPATHSLLFLACSHRCPRIRNARNQ